MSPEWLVIAGTSHCFLPIQRFFMIGFFFLSLTSEKPVDRANGVPPSSFILVFLSDVLCQEPFPLISVVRDRIFILVFLSWV